jgi:nonribosomal peptide synthetase DhbF
LAERWLVGRRLFNAYGPTESAVCTTVGDCAAELPPDIGTPIENLQCYVFDQNLELLPAGVTGELYLAGQGLARGYHDDPALTAERFVPNPHGAPGSRMYRSLDLAKHTRGGRFVFLGRADRQLKIRGFRVELDEVEFLLRKHPVIRDVVVLPREASAGQTRLVAYWVARDGVPALRSHELRKTIQGRIPDYMVPAAFVCLEAIPLTAHGKIDHEALPEPQHVPVEYVAPGTASERTVATLMQELLGIDQVGLVDHFFDLGGHSLLAAQLTARMKQAFEIEVPLRLVFEAPTVAQIAAGIDELLKVEKNALKPLTAVARDGYSSTDGDLDDEADLDDDQTKAGSR